MKAFQDRGCLASTFSFNGRQRQGDKKRSMKRDEKEGRTVAMPGEQQTLLGEGSGRKEPSWQGCLIWEEADLCPQQEPWTFLMF